jgi:NADH-quinone oxidoreductase subunit A
LPSRQEEVSHAAIARAKQARRPIWRLAQPFSTSSSTLPSAFFAAIGEGMIQDYVPVLLELFIATGLALAILVLSVLLGRSARTNRTKDSAYECGMVPVGDAQVRFNVKFYLVAMLFVIFDIEVVFLYPWAITFRSLIVSHGLTVFWSASGFILVLFVAYVYALKKGAFSWK